MRKPLTARIGSISLVSCRAVPGVSRHQVYQVSGNQQHAFILTLKGPLPMNCHFGIKLRLILSALALSLGLGAVVFGQEITGTLVGTVKDTSGASVKGATVTVTAVDKQVVVRI